MSHDLFVVGGILKFTFVFLLPLRGVNVPERGMSPGQMRSTLTWVILLLVDYLFAMKTLIVHALTTLTVVGSLLQSKFSQKKR